MGNVCSGLIKTVLNEFQMCENITGVPIHCRRRAAAAAAANRHCTGQFGEKLLPILWPISPCVLPTIFKCTAVQCINCKDCMGNSGFVSEWNWYLQLGNSEPIILKCMNLYGSLPSFWSSMTEQFETLPISKARIRKEGGLLPIFFSSKAVTKYERPFVFH